MLFVYVSSLSMDKIMSELFLDYNRALLLLKLGKRTGEEVSMYEMFRDCRRLFQIELILLLILCFSYHIFIIHQGDKQLNCVWYIN